MENQKQNIFCGNAKSKTSNFDSEFYACRFNTKDLAKLVRNLSSTDLTEEQIESTAQLLEQHKGFSHADMCSLRQPDEERTHYFKINDFFKNKPLPQEQPTPQQPIPPMPDPPQNTPVPPPPAADIKAEDDIIPF